MANSRLPKARRTQSERRLTTRTALLDATVQCLIEDGYAGVTTAEVAHRAGVTRGAQSHHYATKAELVTSAVLHLSERLLAENLAEALEAPATAATLRQVLDQMWELFTSPLFGAAMEVWIAARTDDHLREHVIRLERDVNQQVASIVSNVFPGMTDRPGFSELLSTTTATIRGIALLTFVRPKASIDKDWDAARDQLTILWHAQLRAPAR